VHQEPPATEAVAEPSSDLAAGAEPTEPTAAASCANCGAPLAGRFCADCGQPADTRIPSLWGLLGEYLDGAFNFDSRIWRTLVPLTMQPGGLTREFLAGRRARYVAPFRVYLVLSLIFFVVSSATDMPSARPARLGPLDVSGEAPDAVCGEYLSPLAPDGLFYSRLLSSCTRIVADGGRELGRDLGSRVPLEIFLCIPLTAAVLKLFYAFSRRKYVEHLYLLLHVHALFFLILTITSLLAWSAAQFAPLTIPTTLLRFTLWIYLVGYGYLALRNVYRQGRLVTLLKYVAFVASYTVMLGLVFFSTFVLTALAL
jgi:hypothetical protein